MPVASISASLRRAIAATRRDCPRRPAIVVVHGTEAGVEDYAPLRCDLAGNPEWVDFPYDYRTPLADSAAALLAELELRSAPTVVLAHGPSALLFLFLGATAGAIIPPGLGAVLLNPWIGGSPFMREGLGAKDLVAGSELLQTIFGRRSRPSAYSSRTVLMFTARPGDDAFLDPRRMPAIYGRSFEDLLRRSGTAIRWPGGGDLALLRQPELVAPAVNALLRGAAAPRSTRPAGGRVLSEGLVRFALAGG